MNSPFQQNRSYTEAAWLSRPYQISSAVAATVEETFISYPSADEVLAQCELRIVSSRKLGQPHFVVMADRQNGKGAIIRWICRRHRPFRVNSEDSAVVPVVVTELPLQPNPNDLMAALAAALGLLQCQDWAELQRRYQAAFVRLVFLRNVQELVDWSSVEQLSILRNLFDFSEAAGLGLVFCGLSEFQRALSNHKDLLGGVPRVSLPLWSADRLGDFLGKLECSWGLPQSSVSRHTNVLCELGTGCIGDITRRIHRAVVAAGVGHDNERFLAELTRG